MLDAWEITNSTSPNYQGTFSCEIFKVLVTPTPTSQYSTDGWFTLRKYLYVQRLSWLYCWSMCLRNSANNVRWRGNQAAAVRCDPSASWKERELQWFCLKSSAAPLALSHFFRVCLPESLLIPLASVILFVVRSVASPLCAAQKRLPAWKKIVGLLSLFPLSVFFHFTSFD